MRSGRTYLGSALSAAAGMLIVHTMALQAQQPQTAKEKQTLDLGAGRLDMAVPDAPAFKILDVNPSSIMKPGTVREVAATLGNLLLNSDGKLPESIALEIAPFMLADSRDPIHNYQESKSDSSQFWRFLRRTRISLATSKDATTGLSLASIGLRVTLWDNTDGRNDSNLTKQVGSIAQDMEILTGTASALSAYPDSLLTGFGPTTLPNVTIPALEEKLHQVRKNAKDTLWFKQIAELGLAMRYASPTGLVSKIVTTGIAGWLSWGSNPFMNAQLLLGGNAILERPVTGGTMAFNTWSASGRLYYGSNNFKGFVEFQTKKIKDTPVDFLFNIGGEASLSGGYWLEFGLGYNATDNSTFKEQFVPKFNIRWGVPERTLKTD